MAKSKYSPALFELIGQQKQDKAPEKLAVPKWFGRAPTAQAEPEPAKKETEHAARPSAPSPSTASPQALQAAPAQPRPVQPTEPSGQSPIVQLRAGRLEISLNPVNAAVTVGIVLLALFSSFMIGQRVGRAPVATDTLASADDDLQAALHQPADSSVLDVGGERATLMGRLPTHPGIEQPAPPKADASGPAVGPPPGGWNPALNYIVIQTFKSDDRAAAELTQRWLASEYELGTRLVPAAKSWQLVTSAGFNFSEPAEKQACQQFIKDLRSLGERCGRELTKAGLPVYRLNDPFAKKFAD